MSALPGVWLDLITDGADTKHGGKSATVKALRQVMLAAHRAGWTYVDIYPLLTDTKGRKLAAQIIIGRGGIMINSRQRDTFLRKHWDDTAAVAAAGSTWAHGDVLDVIEFVRQAFDAAGDLGTRERAVLTAVIDLADQHGTTRVAAPVRVVAEASGLSVPMAYRVLMDLCQRGEWLDVARRGSRRAGRSNLYRLAPAVLETYRGATPPTSQDLPTSHLPTSHQPPMSQLRGESSMSAETTANDRGGSLTINVSGDEEAVMVAALAAYRQTKAAAAAAADRQPATVVDIATRSRRPAS